MTLITATISAPQDGGTVGFDALHPGLQAGEVKIDHRSSCTFDVLDMVALL
jgi:hypothetical protein